MSNSNGKKIYSIWYMCHRCERKIELWFDKTTDVEPETPFECEICGGEIHKFNFKDNKQAWEYMDKRG